MLRRIGDSRDALREGIALPRFPSVRISPILLTFFTLVLLPVRAQPPSFIILDSRDNPWTVYLGSGTGEFGWAGASISSGLDADGNGKPDFLVGAPGSLEGRPGRAFLILDRSGRNRETHLSSGDRILSISSGSDLSDRLGTSVAAVGDVDGDGYDDFLIGIPLSDEAPGGAAALIFGKTDLPARIVLSADIPRLGILFRGTLPGEWTGAAVAGVGDVNGDGRPDLAIGAPSQPGGGPGRTGRVFLVFGGTSLRTFQEQGGRIDLPSLDPGAGLVLEGPEEGGEFGASICGTGDLDGDGVRDLAAGAPEFSPGGAVFLVFGRVGLTAPDLAAPDGMSCVRISTPSTEADLGSSLSGGLDVTGDAIPDLLIGAPDARRQGESRGEAILLSGGPSVRGAATIDVGAPRSGAIHLIGKRGDAAGGSVALTPDATGDSVADVLIGAPRSGSQQGAVYLVDGGPDLPPETFLESLNADDSPSGSTFFHNGMGALAGSAVAGVGDLDGDGIGDLAIGAPNREAGGHPGGGAVYELSIHEEGPPEEEGPKDLTCRTLSGGRVLLSWMESSRFGTLTILRDGASIAVVPGEERYYTDPSPPPGEHVYQIETGPDPKLLSNTCRVVVTTLPVGDLHCEQLPGSTRVRLSWRPGDRYSHLSVSVDGNVIRDDLPGDVASFEFDLGPGIFDVVVSDPSNGPGGPASRCQIVVNPVAGNSIENFACSLVDGGEAVDLTWDPSPVYDHFVISRDGSILDFVEGNSYRDSNPPSGRQSYTLVGLEWTIHPSPPATCSVDVPPPGEEVVQGRVAFADRAGTPIRKGTLRAYVGELEVGSGQVGEDGRFAVAVDQGVRPDSVVFDVRFPRLDDRDPRTEHRIRVQAVVASGDVEVEVEVPVPILAFAGLGEDASMWSALIARLEGYTDAGGRPRGAFSFAFKGRPEIARTARFIESAVGRVRDHLGRYLGSRPDQVDLVAHGFSGLGVRAYLHGIRSSLGPVRAVVLLGTPNLGTNLAALDAMAAAPERSMIFGPEGREDDLFTAAEEQLPSFLEDFNRRVTSLNGAHAHLVAGLGGSNLLDGVLGCEEHDGRVCRESAHGGIPGATLHTTGDVHEKLGRSTASVDLLAEILLGEAAGGGSAGGGSVGGGGGVISGLEPGSSSWSILTETTADQIPLYSDTTGGVIIILNCQLPGVIDFQVTTPATPDDPDGTIVDPATAGALPGVDYGTWGDGEGHQVQVYEFETGQVGTYIATIVNSSTAQIAPYSVQIYLDASLSLTAGVTPGEVEVGEKATVTASIAAGGTLALGAEVEAQVTSPEGSGRVAMLDDGIAPDLAAGDGTYSAALPAAASAGIHVITVRAAGSSPSTFLREVSSSLVVRSEAASLAGPFVSAGEDFESDGDTDGIRIDGKIAAVEAGVYMVVGSLTDSGGDPVAAAGSLFSAAAAGEMTFRLYFDGSEIAAAGRDGPYSLSELELLDGNRGFVLCERLSDVLVTDPFRASDFGGASTPRFIRGDVNADASVDLSDAVAVLGILFSGGLANDCPDAADANADHAIDITDPIYLLEVLFLSGPPIPPPSACGSAPFLGCPQFDACR